MLQPFDQARYLLDIISLLRTYWRNRGYTKQVAAVLLPAFDDERHPANLRARGMADLASMLLISDKRENVKALCERAMDTAPQDLYVQVVALQQLAWLNIHHGNYEVARTYLMKVLELGSDRTSSTEDDPLMDYLFILNHNSMGSVAMNLDEKETARMHFNIAVNGYQQLGESFRAVQAGNNLALLDVLEGRLEVARQHFETSLPMVRATGVDTSIMKTLGNLGWTLMLMSDYASAYAQLSESLQMAVRLKQRTSILYQLETFAELAFRMERYTIAAQLFGYVMKVSEEDSIGFPSGTLEKIQDNTTVMQAKLGSRYHATTYLGSKLSQDAAVALAQSLVMYLDQSPK